MPTRHRILAATACAVFVLACSASTGNSRDAAGPGSSPKPASDEAAAEPDAAGQQMHATPTEAAPGEAGSDDPEAKAPEPASPAAGSNLKAASPKKCKDGEHEPGDRWKDDCNDCWCKDDGSIVCTRKACKQG